ncbi:hypothetical protein DD237_004549 [Peronospora effusa]|uniref:Uncharacterized protein n=1 Tax=Peronospora effusa TaxID=542832 RepID=A0A3R7Y458_9STRA|nr:hypothetical protein DD237_004549 [Peronospora effusa]
MLSEFCQSHSQRLDYTLCDYTLCDYTLCDYTLCDYTLCDYSLCALSLVYTQRELWGRVLENGVLLDKLLPGPKPPRVTKKTDGEHISR